MDDEVRRDPALVRDVLLNLVHLALHEARDRVVRRLRKRDAVSHYVSAHRHRAGRPVRCAGLRLPLPPRRGHIHRTQVVHPRRPVIVCGPWVPIGAGWVRPEWLVREGDFWRDPAGFLYTYAPLPEVTEEPEEEEEELPAGLIAVEYRNKKWIWRTETEESECELSSNQLREIFPSLLGQGRRNTLPR